VSALRLTTLRAALEDPDVSWTSATTVFWCVGEVTCCYLAMLCMWQDKRRERCHMSRVPARKRSDVMPNAVLHRNDVSWATNLREMTAPLQLITTGVSYQKIRFPGTRTAVILSGTSSANSGVHHHHPGHLFGPIDSRLLCLCRHGCRLSLLPFSACALFPSVALS